MAWRKVDHVAEAVEKPKRAKKAKVDESNTETTTTPESSKAAESESPSKVAEDAEAVDINDGVTDDEDEIDVEPWEFDGTTYLLDSKTNQVYDSETQTVIGQRVGDKLAKF
jgi:hypothetical protein